VEDLDPTVQYAHPDFEEPVRVVEDNEPDRKSAWVKPVSGGKHEVNVAKSQLEPLEENA